MRSLPLRARPPRERGRRDRPHRGRAGAARQARRSGSRRRSRQRASAAGPASPRPCTRSLPSSRWRRPASRCASTPRAVSSPARAPTPSSFVLAPNPGMAPGPLREIASGGELSRVMLALMTAATGARGAATVVFDEVDAGLGGATARVVGEKLRALAETRQVLCITHLPQVASLGARHFRVVKGVRGAATAQAEVERLGRRELVAELCRMLGADSGDLAARRHAGDAARGTRRQIQRPRRIRAQRRPPRPRPPGRERGGQDDNAHAGGCAQATLPFALAARGARKGTARAGARRTW